ncbi:MAG: hypothetical protein HZA34_03540 [Candidatus Pacebacteria bacterium]|nr:hypothetical protein [Candidatus Paceibacterota bacterium]
MQKDTHSLSRTCEHTCSQSYTTSNTVYGLAFLGSVVYFIQHATTFWEGVLGVGKAVIWPALLAYKLLEFFKF